MQLTCRSGGALAHFSPEYSADSRLLFVPVKNDIKAYSSETGGLVRILARHEDQVTSIKAIGEDRIVSVSMDGQLIKWQVSTGRVLKERKFSFPIHQVLLLGEDDYLLVSHVVGPDRHPLRVQFNDRVRGCFTRLYRAVLVKGHPSTGNAQSLDRLKGPARIDTRGGQVAVATKRKVRLLALTDGDKAESSLSELSSIEHPSRITAIRFHPSIDIVAVADKTGRIGLWSFRTDGPVRTLHWHSDQVRSVAFFLDGQFMLSGGSRGCWSSGRSTRRSADTFPSWTATWSTLPSVRT